MLHCHIMPQGTVDLTTLHKNPPLILDDWTSKDFEPQLTFLTAKMEFMIWLYNMRITYPTEAIYIAANDVSGGVQAHDVPPQLLFPP